MLNDYKNTAQKTCSAKISSNGNQYSVHLHLCMMHRLLFHETMEPEELYARPCLHASIS